MNALGMKGERHPNVPRIEKKEWNNRYLDAKGKLVLKKPIVKRIVTDDEIEKISATCESNSQAKKWLRESNNSITEEEIKEVLNNATQIKRIDSPELNSIVTIDLNEQYRSIAHTVLKCLALFMPEEIKTVNTEIKEFVREKKGDWRSFAVDTKQYMSVQEQIEKTFRVNHNSVEIYFSSTYRMIIGVVKILNNIKRAVIISNNYAGKDKILYIFEDTSLSKLPPEAILCKTLNINFPIIDIQCFANLDEAIQFFRQELFDLCGDKYTRDCITSTLIEEIDQIHCKAMELNQELFEDYKQIIMNFFEKIKEILSKPIDIDGISSFLNREFDTLIKEFEGRKSNDPDFQQLLNSLFFSAVQKIHEVKNIN